MDAKRDSGSPPAVGIIMGSDSDWKTMQPAARVLDSFAVPYEAKVVSAHRSPDYLFEYAGSAKQRGLSLIIAGAGGAAHLPGMTASKTIVPVVGVPVVATPLNGLDALLSIMQMPSEVGVATVSIGPKGANDAGLFAVAALALKDHDLRTKLRVQRGLPPVGVGTPAEHATVAILAQDPSDFQVLQYTEEYLTRLGIVYRKFLVEPNAPPDALAQQLAEPEAEGAAVLIAGSRGGINFACEVAQITPLPVLGVPIVAGPVGCIDEFLRPFREMPPGVATFAVGKPGAINAALFAATIISGRGSSMWEKLWEMRLAQIDRVKKMTLSAV